MEEKKKNAILRKVVEELREEAQKIADDRRRVKKIINPMAALSRLSQAKQKTQTQNACQ